MKPQLLYHIIILAFILGLWIGFLFGYIIAIEFNAGNAGIEQLGEACIDTLNNCISTMNLCVEKGFK